MTIIIPFDKIKDILIYKRQHENWYSDRSWIKFLVKGNKLIVNKEPAYDYIDISTNQDYLKKDAEDFRKDAMRSYKDNLTEFQVYFSFSEDPSLYERMQKAIDDLKKYFNTSELY